MSAVVANAMSALLYETSVLDAPAYAGAMSVMAAAAIIASVAPARRASALNPMSVFRED